MFCNSRKFKFIKWYLWLKNKSMKEISLEKVVVHICTGESGAKLDNAKNIDIIN